MNLSRVPSQVFREKLQELSLAELAGFLDTFGFELTREQKTLAVREIHRRREMVSRDEWHAQRESSALNNFSESWWKSNRGNGTG